VEDLAAQTGRRKRSGKIGEDSVFDDDTFVPSREDLAPQPSGDYGYARDFDAEEMTMIRMSGLNPSPKHPVFAAESMGQEGSVPVVVRLPGAGPIEFTSIPPHVSSHDEGWAGEQAGEAAIKRILARKKEKAYEVPVDGILNTYPDGQYWIIDDKTRQSAEVLRSTLAEFGIEAEVTGIRKGPVITMFEILPAPGVKLSKITNLGDNIALRLAASSVRIVAPIPGKHAVGIEVPNEKRAIVSLREIVDHEAFKTAKMEIPVVLGKDIAGEVQFIDLTATPHLLIAGATGSGKSVCVNSIILSILYRRSPEEVKLLLIDPKIVELKLYNDIPHLLTPVITEPKRAFQALQYCICEMERRYSMLDKIGVRDIKSYNRRVREKNLAQEKLPYIVVIVDEFADLMATTGKELESTLARLAAMSRAVGIHLVLATQRPSIDVITGLIKANIPSRIAFMVAGKFDSRIIIDMVGAEKLLGKGDMHFSGAADPFPVRMQGAFVSDDEVEKAVEFVRTLGAPEYIDDEIFFDEDEESADPTLFDDGDGDPLFEKALEIVMQQGKASASYIQRRLKVGYNRAARLVELMEQRGIVGPAQGSKPRDLVRNPDITGRNNMTGDSPGRPERPDRVANASGSAQAASRRTSLMPDAETLPGQRVTGRDED
jgi:S-DNA-T family DNA segregation ATPase FtsK/SpoIIIE